MYSDRADVWGCKKPEPDADVSPASVSGEETSTGIVGDVIPMVKRPTGRTIPDLTKREHLCEYQSTVSTKEAKMTREERDEKEFEEWIRDALNDPKAEQSLSPRACWFASRRLLREEQAEDRRCAQI